MGKYIANSYLLHKGEIIKNGEEVELTDEQAKKLGDKVTPASFTEDKKLEDYKVEELKDFAQQQGIEGYDELKKAELIKALEGK